MQQEQQQQPPQLTISDKRKMVYALVATEIYAKAADVERLEHLLSWLMRRMSDPAFCSLQNMLLRKVMTSINEDDEAMRRVHPVVRFLLDAGADPFQKIHNHSEYGTPTSKSLVEYMHDSAWKDSFDALTDAVMYEQ